VIVFGCEIFQTKKKRQRPSRGEYTHCGCMQTIRPLGVTCSCCMHGSKKTRPCRHVQVLTDIPQRKPFLHRRTVFTNDARVTVSYEESPEMISNCLDVETTKKFKTVITSVFCKMLCVRHDASWLMHMMQAPGVITVGPENSSQTHSRKCIR